MIAVSVPSYRRLRNTSHSHSVPRSNPWDTSSSRHRRVRSSAAALASAGAGFGWFKSETGYEPAKGR